MICRVGNLMNSKGAAIACQPDYYLEERILRCSRDRRMSNIIESLNLNLSDFGQAVGVENGSVPCKKGIIPKPNHDVSVCGTFAECTFPFL